MSYSGDSGDLKITCSQYGHIYDGPIKKPSTLPHGMNRILINYGNKLIKFVSHDC